MVYSNQHNLLTFGGSAWGGAETWQFGLRTMHGLPLSEGQMDDVEAAASAFMSSGATKFDSGAKLEWIKAAQIQADGTYPPDLDAVLRELTTPVAGSGTQPTYPQITLCVSLTTDRTRGLAHGGRFYPPPTCHVVDGSGRIAVSYQNVYRDAAATFISAINQCGIGPVTIYSKVGAGAQNEVTGVRVGRVFDTQRRRRSSLAEEYSAATVTAA